MKQNTNRLLKKSLFSSAGSISGDVQTWVAPIFSILEPLRESFFATPFFSTLLDKVTSALAERSKAQHDLNPYSVRNG